MSEPLKLWLLTRTDHSYHDVFKTAIVVASDEDKARYIHPDPEPESKRVWHDGAWAWYTGQTTIVDEHAGADWTHPDNIHAKLIGVADESLMDGSVILSEYDAG